MVPIREVSAGIAGAIQLAKFDRDGLLFFDDTEARFWLSFHAAVVVAPLFIVYVIVRYLTEPTADGFVHFVIIHMLSYVISWVAFPLVMAHLVGQLDRQRHYFRFIAAYNWAGVLQNGVFIPIATLGITGALSADLASSMTLIILLWVLGYTFFIVRAALDLPAGTAAAVVFMNFLLGLFIEAVTGRYV